jgi:hypothetical protein
MTRSALPRSLPSVARQAFARSKVSELSLGRDRAAEFPNDSDEGAA